MDLGTSEILLTSKSTGLFRVAARRRGHRVRMVKVRTRRACPARSRTQAHRGRHRVGTNAWNLEPRPDPEPLLLEVTPEAAYPENTVGLHCLSATKIQQRSVERDLIPA